MLVILKRLYPRVNKATLSYIFAVFLMKNILHASAGDKTTPENVTALMINGYCLNGAGDCFSAANLGKIEQALKGIVFVEKRQLSSKRFFFLRHPFKRQLVWRKSITTK